MGPIEPSVCIGMAAQIPTLLDILAAIPRLTPGEQDQVAAAVKAAQALGAGTKTKGKAHAPTRADMHPDVRDVLSAICDHLNRYGGDGGTPSMAATLKEYREFLEPSAPVVMDAIRDMMPDTTHRRALLAMGVKLLYDDLRKWMPRPNARALMKRAHQIPGCIEIEFPGYHANGMLRLIFQTRTERNG